jgi:GH15 family glucan-1,4-alpha-glucosidase
MHDSDAERAPPTEMSDDLIEPMTTERYRPIGDYALLSDCHSTALVSCDGSIDWACLRRMDAESTFARILDHDRGGYFSIAPTEPIIDRSRRYLDRTMVLETTLTTGSGSITITDAFAMRRGGAQDPRGELLRRVRGVSGEVEVEIVVEPEFDFGEVAPWLRIDDNGRVTAIGSDDALVFHADFDWQIDRVERRLVTRKAISQGESIHVVAVAQAAHRIDPSAADAACVEEHLDETVEWWRTWSEATTADGPHADLVERSALVLKSLNCVLSGAIIAAPTTSLPEIVGGDANWDYRYCWVRDATLALQALSIVGHEEMAQGFRDFIMRSAAGHGAELQIMYGIFGERRLPEIELDLEGWRGSRPVRMGNAAAKQVQTDVYGHLLDAAHLWQGHADDGIDADEWRFLASVVERAIDHWDMPDAGIWELRGEPRHYVHSKLMVWVALNRGISLVENHDVDHVDLDRWKSVRDEIRTAIETHGLDPTGTHFVQHFGGTRVDASLLKLALMEFVGPDDPRMVATVEVIQRDLECGPDGFIRRFCADADEEPGTGQANDDEGVFLLCTFWLVEVLAMLGRNDEATALFERAIGTGNDLGLFAEEFDVERNEMVGNFPQAFTHLGLIVADARLRELARS